MFSSKYVVSALDYATKGLTRLQVFFAVFSLLLLTIGTFLSPIVNVFAVDNTINQQVEASEESEIDSLNYLDVSPDQIPIVEEDISRRTANEKHFKNMDGTYEVSIYPEDVHFYKDNQ